MQFLKKNYIGAKGYNDKCLTIDPTRKEALDLNEKLINKFDNPTK
jgi:hypothetical protein